MLVAIYVCIFGYMIQCNTRPLGVEEKPAVLRRSLVVSSDAQSKKLFDQGVVFPLVSHQTKSPRELWREVVTDRSGSCTPNFLTESRQNVGPNDRCDWSST